MPEFESASSGPSTIIPAEMTHFAAVAADLALKAQDTCTHLFHLKSENPDDYRVRCVRMRTADTEYVIAPGDGVTLVIMQRDPAVDAAAAQDGEAGEGEGEGEA